MRKLLIALGLLLSLNVALFAQATTQVSGVVTDPTGAVIPGTNIDLQNLETGLKRSATSDDAGAYAFLQVIPGQYRISATATGFRGTTINDVRLLVNNPTTVNIKMEVGQITETFDLRPALQRVNAPVLVIHGAYDPLESAQEVHEAFPGSRLEMIPKAGHLIGAEQAEPYGRAVVAFGR